MLGLPLPGLDMLKELPGMKLLNKIFGDHEKKGPPPPTAEDIEG